MAMLEIRDLKVYYGMIQAIKGISFDVNQGEVIALIGANGAGKTTTIKSILGFAHPDCGEISYFGLPFSENEREIKQRIGFSTGAVNYYPKKKIKNIVAITKTFYKNWDETAYREYRRISQCTNGATCHIVTNRIKQF